MPTLLFRRGDPADSAELAALMLRTFRDTYRLDHFGDCRVEDVEAYAAESFGPAVQDRELADTNLLTVLAVVDGALAGYAQVRLASPCPTHKGALPTEIARFYVDRPWHGQGTAWALMREAVACVPEADPLWLTVYARNARARAFYAKWGFTPVGVHTFTMGEDVQDDIVLARFPATPIPPAPNAR